MTKMYLNKLYEMKLVIREMTRNWLHKFDKLTAKLEKRNK